MYRSQLETFRSFHSLFNKIRKSIVFSLWVRLLGPVQSLEYCTFIVTFRHGTTMTKKKTNAKKVLRNHYTSTKSTHIHSHTPLNAIKSHIVNNNKTVAWFSGFTLFPFVILLKNYPRYCEATKWGNFSTDSYTNAQVELLSTKTP